ncbi:hypothetical protein ES703_120329 [subsurface metagenome]
MANEYPPLQFSGEPDALAEVRLRAELKLLRTIATMHERTTKMRGIFMKRWPGVYEAMEIVDSGHVIEEELRLAPRVKERLLQVEAYFVEKGWHLPKWKTQISMSK